MRRALPSLALAAALGVVAPPARAQGECLSQGDMREVITSNRVVSPVVALRAARDANPGSDVMRARLCQNGNRLVYILMVLRRDGRFVEVAVDAASGRLAALP